MGEKPVTLPVAEFRNNSTWAVVKASSGEESFALLLRDDYCYSTLWTLSVPDAYPDFYRMPSPVLDRIRQSMPVRGVWLEGPSRISLFVYDNDRVIIYPYVMDGVQRTVVSLHARGAKALIRKRDEKRFEPVRANGDEAVFELAALPGQYELYEILR